MMKVYIRDLKASLQHCGEKQEKEEYGVNNQLKETNVITIN